MARPASAGRRRFGGEDRSPVLKHCVRYADKCPMHVFTRPDLYSQAPPTARQEPHSPLFIGSPAQVAEFLGPRMEQRTHTIALVTAELRHLARAGWPSDSLTFVLRDETSVTVRP
jgi:hypothetical protein